MNRYDVLCLFSGCFSCYYFLPILQKKRGRISFFSYAFKRWIRLAHSNKSGRIHVNLKTIDQNRADHNRHHYHNVRAGRAVSRTDRRRPPGTAPWQLSTRLVADCAQHQQLPADERHLHTHLVDAVGRLPLLVARLLSVNLVGEGDSVIQLTTCGVINDCLNVEAEAGRL